MGKIRTRKILFVVAAMLLCVLVAVLIRLFFSNRIVRMTLTPIEVEVGEAVHYADSTRNASSWLWEFGNGDVSHERSGQYVFKEPGRYQVRLQVDHSLEKKQIVKVNRRANNYGSDQLVKIEAPATAFQGEIISFKGYGPSREWRWQFGESGIVDSREQNPLYAYSEAVQSASLTFYTVGRPLDYLIFLENSGIPLNTQIPARNPSLPASSLPLCL